MQELLPQNISTATARNWQRLHTDQSHRLTTRANKTRSARRVVAAGYLSDAKAGDSLLAFASRMSGSLPDIMYTLCQDRLRAAGILDAAHVQCFLRQFAHLHQLPVLLPQEVWHEDEDQLGFVYQSLLTEGERNSNGQYYTHHAVVSEMLSACDLSDGKTLLDPCCGSGAFLLGVRTDSPESLYGFDADPVAVLLAGTNLLVRFSTVPFEPHVYCLDFLRRGLFAEGQDKHLPEHFDYICTNPPWGTDKKRTYCVSYPEVQSRERASMFLVEALRRLAPDGRLIFLLPTSILKTKTHQDIRHHVLRHTAIEQVWLPNGRFDGVYTDYFSIRLAPGKVTAQHYVLRDGEGDHPVSLTEEDLRENRIVFVPQSELGKNIIGKMEAARHDDLRHSQWALGIVTGDNKGKLFPAPQPGMVAVSAGKQVQPFLMQEATKWLTYAPETFQQCPKEEYFLAPEKLIYRFIAKYPVVAYDDRQRYCLNSANILVPEVDGLSVKGVAALLNSAPVRFYYSSRFHDVKVLKGSLQKLPFPAVSAEVAGRLEELVDEILRNGTSEDALQAIDGIVATLYGLTDEELEYVKTQLS